MDSANIINFYLAKLNDKTGSSSNKTPNAASRKNQSSSTSNKKQKQQEVVNPVQQELVDNVAGLRKSVEAVAHSGLTAQIESYKKEIFDLEKEKFMNLSMTPAYEAFIIARVEDIKKTIKTIEDQISSLGPQPKSLTYATSSN